MQHYKTPHQIAPPTERKPVWSQNMTNEGIDCLKMEDTTGKQSELLPDNLCP